VWFRCQSMAISEELLQCARFLIDASLTRNMKALPSELAASALSVAATLADSPIEVDCSKLKQLF